MAENNTDIKSIDFLFRGNKYGEKTKFIHYDIVIVIDTRLVCFTASSH